MTCVAKWLSPLASPKFYNIIQCAGHLRHMLEFLCLVPLYFSENTSLIVMVVWRITRPVNFIIQIVPRPRRRRRPDHAMRRQQVGEPNKLTPPQIRQCRPTAVRRTLPQCHRRHPCHQLRILPQRISLSARAGGILPILISTVSIQRLTIVAASATQL